MTDICVERSLRLPCGGPSSRQLLLACYYAYRIPDFRGPIIRSPLLMTICSVPYLALFGLEGQALIDAFWAANVLVMVLSVRVCRRLADAGRVVRSSGVLSLVVSFRTRRMVARTHSNC